MTDKHLWIQLENRPWDISPNNIDRLDGMNPQDKGIPQETVTLTSPETAVSRDVLMFNPVRKDKTQTGSANLVEALILRRYTENWAAPDDRKVNPWDVNEHDPTDNGTMGTIPGAVIECNVGDRVFVHFRNKDFRGMLPLDPGVINPPFKVPVPGVPTQSRTHSLHTHGFVFDATYDGAYPLSPPDPTQPVGTEAARWASVGVTGFKKGDRVPPGGTFTYIWNTFSWPTTAGIWLYHDHSICDTHNMELGAIGIVVIHQSEQNDPDEVVTQDLPDGSLIGSPVEINCFGFPPGVRDIPVHPHDLNQLSLGAHSMNQHEMMRIPENKNGNEKKGHPPQKNKEGRDMPKVPFTIRRGDIQFELDSEFKKIIRICLPFYRQPPNKAQYLLLFHNLQGAGMCINGRKYLGNTPTVVAGPNTKMRFGVVGMGNIDGFHTFHVHGHRWVIAGPDGNNPNDIQNSPQIKAVSQFEDTRTFGPANSFGFTINQGSFMGAPVGNAVGEWHMHCHVLNHMMDGMMGSLLVVQGGELALGLPSGEMCPAMEIDGGHNGGGGDQTIIEVGGNEFSFRPNDITVPSGTTVTFNFQDSFHTVTTTSTTNNATSIEINNGGGPTDAVPGGMRPVVVTGNPGGQINYRCGIHTSMTGNIHVS